MYVCMDVYCMYVWMYVWPTSIPFYLGKIPWSRGQRITSCKPCTPSFWQEQIKSSPAVKHDSGTGTRPALGDDRSGPKSINAYKEVAVNMLSITWCISGASQESHGLTSEGNHNYYFPFRHINANRAGQAASANSAGLNFAWVFHEMDWCTILWNSTMPQQIGS